MNFMNYSLKITILECGEAGNGLCECQHQCERSEGPYSKLPNWDPTDTLELAGRQNHRRHASFLQNESQQIANIKRSTRTGSNRLQCGPERNVALDFMPSVFKIK
jgi:hypothetical protein